MLNRLDNLKIGPKLIGSFVVVALIAATIGVIGYTGINAVDAELSEIGKVRMPSLDYLAQMAENQQAIWVGERGLTNDRMLDPELRQAQYDWIEEKEAAAEEAYEDFAPLEQTEEEAEIWKKFEPLWADWLAKHQKVVELSKEADSLMASGASADDPRVQAKLQQAFDASLTAREAALASTDVLGDLLQLQRDVAESSFAAATAAANSRRLLMIVSSVAGLAIAILLGVVLSRRISDPMQQAVYMIGEMGQGHLGERLEITREDEIGELASSMDQFADDLQVHVIGSMQRLADGDVDVEVPVRDEDDEIGPAINGTAGALRKLITEMNHMSDEHDAGDIDVVIPAEEFEGAYADVAQGVNDMVNGHITVKKKAMACVEQFGQGNFDAELEQFPGKKAFINDIIEEVRDNLKGVANEIRGLSQGVEKGDLTVRGKEGRFEGDWEDLIGGLNRLVEAFVQPLEEAGEVLEAAADRDLTQRVEGDYRGDLKDFADNINRALKAMDESLGQVAAAVVQVAEASGQISSGSQQLAEGASEQASSLQEVSSSLEELGAMTRQNAGNAGEARNLSNEAAESAATGDEAMGRMSEAMDRIQNSSEETAKIVNTIDEIAFQTNLLALNAAVEAARAGDAGKGFAVVAEEVRNLAQRSAEAAKDTADMIEDAVKNAEGGVEISQEVAEALTEIASGATNVNELVAEIAAASDEQAQGLEQINTAVGEMDSVTQNNAANSEESASAAEELSAQAQELRGMVETFRLTTASNASGGTSLKLVGKDGDAAETAGKAPQGQEAPERAIPLDDDDDMEALANF